MIFTKRFFHFAATVPLALGLAFSFPTASFAGKPTAQSKMQLGELLFFNGNIDGAINAFRYASSLNPKMYEPHLNLLNMYLQKKDYDAAVEEWKEVKRLKPDLKDIDMMLVNIDITKGDLPGAVTQCKEILKEKPDDKNVHMILGNLLRMQNNYDEAIEHLNSAAANGANPSVTSQSIAMTHLLKANSAGQDKAKAEEALKNAEAAINDAIARQPKNPDAHVLRGVIKFRQQQKEEALAEMDAAIKAKGGKYADAHKQKGDMLTNDKKFDQALEEYRMALKDDPKYVPALGGMANVYFEKGDISHAKQAYDRALEINPQDKDSYYGRGLMLQKSGDTPGAISDFEKGLSLENDPNMRTQITNLLAQLKGSTGLGMFGGGGLGGLGNYNVGAGMGGGTLGGENPFGVDFKSMVKLKAPSGAKKEKEEK